LGDKKLVPLYGRRKNCTFVVFFEQFIHLKENLHYYNLLDAKNKFYKRRKHPFIREKIHKNGRSRKDPREKKKVVPLLSSSNMSSISNKNFIHHNKKDMQKYLNLVEVENIREKTKKLYLCCLKQMNDLPDLKIC